MVDRFWRYQWFCLSSIFPFLPFFNASLAVHLHIFTSSGKSVRGSQGTLQILKKNNFALSLCSAWFLLHLNSLDGRIWIMLCFLNDIRTCQTIKALSRAKGFLFFRLPGRNTFNDHFFFLFFFKEGLFGSSDKISLQTVSSVLPFNWCLHLVCC